MGPKCLEIIVVTVFMAMNKSQGKKTNRHMYLITATFKLSSTFTTLLSIMQ